MQITQAILPVAGLGTRFLPWTKVVPKELLPIGNKPIIALLVDECLSVGISDICIVISRGKEAIPQYFSPSPVLQRELERRGKHHMISELTRYANVRLHIAYQEEMKGDGHALLSAKSWVRDGMLAVLFGDDLVIGERNGLQQLHQAYRELPSQRDTCVLCVQEVAPEHISKYGVIDVDGDWAHAPGSALRLRKVRGLVEKPEPDVAPSNLGIVGKYLIPSSIFGTLASIERGSKDASAPLSTGSEIRLIDALMTAHGDVDIYGCILEGTRLDTGTPAGYREAVALLG